MSFEIREAGINGLGPSETGGRGSLQLAGKRTTGRGRYIDVAGERKREIAGWGWYGGGAKIRSWAGNRRSLGVFGKTSIWHFRREFAGK